MKTRMWLSAFLLCACAALVQAVAGRAAVSSSPGPAKLFSDGTPHTPVIGKIYYISPDGNNTSGTSWASAWSELDQIEWQHIEPGDTIMLDGGASEMVYHTALVVGADGAPDQPISIVAADAPGRDGKVIIDGGLTYWACGATEPSPYSESHPPGTRRTGINLNGRSWIVVDGGRWGGIEIRNHTLSGVELNGARHVRIANLHLHHNSYADTADGLGVGISGEGILLERLEINNNGQDAIQGGDVTNLVLQDSYLHDHYCSHPDGIQLYYGENSGITIRRNFFRHFLQAIFLGEANENALSTTSDVHISYNIIDRSTYGIKSHNDENRRWKVYNNTIVDIEEQGIHLYRIAGEVEVVNNILVNGGFVLRNGTESNNLFFSASGAPARGDDPLFVDREGGDYQLQPSSPAIDRGTDVGLSADYRGAPVPFGGGVDIGALEYGAVVPATPSPFSTTPPPISDSTPTLSPLVTPTPDSQVWLPSLGRMPRLHLSYRGEGATCLGPM